MPIRKKVTLQHLASQLNLSVHTVSKALRGLPGMSEETRKEVFNLARSMGYRTKEQERSLAVELIPQFTTKPRTFRFIVIEKMRYSVLHQLIQKGLQDKMGEFGHCVETLILPDVIDTLTFGDWLEENNVVYSDGIFIPPAIDEKLERRLLALQVPRIMINFPPPSEKVDSVIWDVESSIYQSVRYLMSMNHRFILYIGDTVTYRGFGIRWRAFQGAMAEAGLEVDPDEHVIGKISGKEKWRAEVIDKLRRTKPSAILAAVPFDLAWIYYACSAAGLRIPEDCSLIGLQDERNELAPSLTRPILLIYDSGIRAAERMLWRLANPLQPYESTLLQGPFFDGDTVLPRSLPKSCSVHHK
ncbi:LacI family DNA-binding transcriptional regulator [Paenibacillus eucommiae]|uniref:LacI family transcriptional regulator n=1 Tax=Paenibacillus eucommiae TaxID=1355755 RepID=A0ABS4ISR4_9BACL|nr:LacI family DNA-binding transcriptional regulator [Paenibacillus eucommiae]MBP1990590.1 LacI family transcriptional regulator [Paenibacillus eucommiae]